MRDKDKNRASEQLEAIVRDNPTKYPQAWYYLGSIAYEEKKFDKAAEYFNKAIVISPDFEAAYYDLAGMQINSGQANLALVTLEKARAKFPQSFVAEFFTGLAYNKLKNYAEAIRHLTGAEVIARATDPKKLNQSFYFQLGATYERNHDFAEAEKYFQLCLDLEPDFAEALNYLGYMWAERGEQLEKALELIERAVKLEPKNAAYLDSLGWVFFKMNQPSDALGYIRKAIEIDEEKDASLYDHLGEIYRALKQTAKAREAWQKSLQLESNDDVKKKLESISPAQRQ